MSETSIEWADFTHNCWWGCQEVGDPDGPDGIDPACYGCYARVRAENPYWWGKAGIFPVWGQDVGRRFFSEAHYLEPYKWNRAAQKAGIQKRVFCMSMGDWAEGRPDQRPYLDKYLYPVIEETPWLIWLLLTKRPQIARTIVPEHWQRDGWPKNAWPGTTAVTQKWWDIRVPALMAIPAERQFVSAEPLMEQINIGDLRPPWIITGGRSGAKSEPTHPLWFRSMRDQCLAAGIAFHHKQNGEYMSARVRGATWDALDPPVWPAKTGKPHDWGDGYGSVHVGKKAAGRTLDGRTWDQFPTVAR